MVLHGNGHLDAFARMCRVGHNDLRSTSHYRLTQGFDTKLCLDHLLPTYYVGLPAGNQSIIHTGTAESDSES